MAETNNIGLSAFESRIEYAKSKDILSDARVIIDSAQRFAHQAVNTALVRRNWLLGKRIAEEELDGEERAEYGTQVIKRLAKQLTEAYGKGFSKTNLYQFRQFYEMFPEIFHAPSGQSLQLLSWTHYRSLIRVTNSKASFSYHTRASEFVTLMSER